MEKGARRKQQANVLVEEFKQKLAVVAEGHTTLRREIAGVAKDLKEEIQQVNRTVAQVGREMRAQRAQLDHLTKQMDEGFGQVVTLLTAFETQMREHIHVN